MPTKKSIVRILSKLFIFIFTLTLSFSALSVTLVQVAGIHYVSPGGTGDCSSWANTCTLQTALTYAVSDDEIWVVAGTYKPTTETNRNATFQLKSGVALYGGFAGTETERGQRNPTTNLTILSGDIDNNDSQTPIITDLTTITGNTTNSYHVVTGATGATLDGFTITAGNSSDPSGPNGSGGGMYNDTSSPTLTNVTFSGNSAGYAGGGMENYADCNPTLKNVTFSGNSADRGGGMYNLSSSPTIRNTIFWGNTSQIDNYDTASSPVVSDSVVQGGYVGGTNIITTDPKLGILGDYGGLTQTVPLLVDSSAIDTGNDSFCPATDQRGVTRPQGSQCDIGAYEKVHPLFLPLILR